MNIYQTFLNKVSHIKTETDFYQKKVPFHLWAIMAASMVIPMVINYFLGAATPLILFLLWLIPIVIFVFHFELKRAVVATVFLVFFQMGWGVIYQLLQNQFIVGRIYNHLGFALISFAFAFLLGKLIKELKESEYRYRNVVENSPQLVVIHQHGEVLYANPTAVQLAGVSEANDVIGTSIFDFIHPLNTEQARHRNQKVLEDQRGNDFIEYKLINTAGEQLYVELLGSKITYKGKPAIMVVGKDVTSKKKYQQEMEYMAYHDPLTSLPNRFLLNKHLEEALTACREHQKRLSLMFIDLDRFKFVNDTVGHKLGDQLLVKVSERLVNSVNEGEMVARQGGDEFLILIKDTDPAGVRKTAERILNSFAAPFTLSDEEFYISPSIGISLYPENGEDSNTLIKHADTAMYMAKKGGRNKYQFYIHENEEAKARKNIVEHGLKTAVKNNELILNYQPKVDLKTGEIYAMEALLRWHHPTLGLITPLEFISVAEETGMVVPIGKWVLQEACKQNRKWQDEGMEINIAVNVSSLQFEDVQFVEMVKKALSSSQLLPEYLILEITESVMQDIQHSAVAMEKLNELGVKVAIDDFGTGYSSLSVLNKLPIDLVKIDKSFVNEVMTNSNTASLVKTMIEMGEHLNFDIVAEGIEDEQQAEFLIQNGCRFGQGYYYSRPLSSGEAEVLFKQYRSLV